MIYTVFKYSLKSSQTSFQPRPPCSLRKLVGETTTSNSMKPHPSLFPIDSALLWFQLPTWEI